MWFFVSFNEELKVSFHWVGVRDVPSVSFNEELKDHEKVPTFGGEKVSFNEELKAKWIWCVFSILFKYPLMRN